MPIPKNLGGYATIGRDSHPKQMDIKQRVFQLKGLLKAREYESALGRIREALQKSPNDGQLLLLLAQVYLRQGQLSEAQVIIDRLLRTDHSNYELLIAKGDLLYRQGDFPRAWEYFCQARRLKQDNYVLGRMVSTLLQLKRLGEAEYYTRLALETSPQDPLFLKYLAQIFKRQQKWEQALEVYQKVIELNPTDGFSYKEYLQLKSRACDPQEIEEQLKSILKLEEKRDNPYLHALRAQNLRNMGRWEEAIAEYKEALRLAPGDRYFLKQLGYCYLHLKRYPEAAQSLRLPFIHNPREVYVRKALLVAYQKSRDREGLLNTLEEAIERHPRLKGLHSLRRLYDRKTRKA